MREITMRVFISWSGERSKQVAEALRRFLKRVNQRVVPWLSSEDILKGVQWGADITNTLSSTNVGILCLTRDNVNSPWVLFEAGALSKLGTSRVVPFLLDLELGELRPPISLFNGATRSKSDVYRILLSVNAALDGGGIATEDLAEQFEKWWPDFSAELDAIKPVEPGNPTQQPQPTDRLENIETIMVQLTRAISDLQQSFPSKSAEEPFHLETSGPFRNGGMMLGRQAAARLVEEAGLRLSNPDLPLDQRSYWELVLLGAKTRLGG